MGMGWYGSSALEEGAIVGCWMRKTAIYNNFSKAALARLAMTAYIKQSIGYNEKELLHYSLLSLFATVLLNETSAPSASTSCLLCN